MPNLNTVQRKDKSGSDRNIALWHGEMLESVNRYIYAIGYGGQRAKSIICIRRSADCYDFTSREKSILVYISIPVCRTDCHPVQVLKQRCHCDIAIRHDKGKFSIR